MPSDTEVQAYIRGASTFKINLKCDSVESSTVKAQCSCPAAKKNQLCKHIWATLLKTESSHPDFLDGKNEIENSSIESSEIKNKPSKSSAQIESQAKYKAQQNDYRKIQYQKQKIRMQHFKLAKANALKNPGPEQLPMKVHAAFNFFVENGFSFNLPLNETEVGLAKKKLSRLFHPDAGGTHDEILELNNNHEILINYIKSKI